MPPIRQNTGRASTVLRGGNAGASSGVPFQFGESDGQRKVDFIGPFRERLSAARCATMRNIDDAESQFISLSACGPPLPTCAVHQSRQLSEVLRTCQSSDLHCPPLTPKPSVTRRCRVNFQKSGLSDFGTGRSYDLHVPAVIASPRDRLMPSRNSGFTSNNGHFWK